MAGRIVLETQRLLLREFDEGDADVFYRLGSDPDVTRYTADPGGGFTSFDQARATLLSHPVADYAKYGYGRWVCVLKESNVVIGFAGLKYLEDLQEVDIGFRLFPSYWGQGLATEAARAVLHFGFDQLRLDSIVGLVMPDNTTSIRVLEKLGLKRIGMVQYERLWVAKYQINQSSGLADGKAEPMI